MPKKDIDKRTWVHAVSDITRYAHYYFGSTMVAELDWKPDLDRLASIDKKDTIDTIARKSNLSNPLFNALYNSLIDDIDDICLDPDDDYCEEDDSEFYFGTSWIKQYIRAIRTTKGTVNFSCRGYYRRKKL